MRDPHLAQTGTFLSYMTEIDPKNINPTTLYAISLSISVESASRQNESQAPAHVAAETFCQ
jgi:hypothetical protein